MESSSSSLLEWLLGDGDGDGEGVSSLVGLRRRLLLRCCSGVLSS